MEKQNIWFLTLFSILLILCVYYISIPTNAFTEYDTSISEETSMAMEETDSLIAQKIEKEEETLETISTLETTLMDVSKPIEEINTAYEALLSIHKKNSKEEEIETFLKTQFGNNVMAKINDNQVSIIMDCKEHTKELANNIIQAVQALVDKEAYITVKFQ